MSGSADRSHPFDQILSVISRHHIQRNIGAVLPQFSNNLQTIHASECGQVQIAEDQIDWIALANDQQPDPSPSASWTSAFCKARLREYITFSRAAKKGIVVHDHDPHVLPQTGVAVRICAGIPRDRTIRLDWCDLHEDISAVSGETCRHPRNALEQRSVHPGEDPNRFGLSGCDRQSGKTDRLV